MQSTSNNNNAYAYIFVCNDQTQERCLEGLLGSPRNHFHKMKETINEDTVLFLFNFSSNKLYGPNFAKQQSYYL